MGNTGSNGEGGGRRRNSDHHQGHGRVHGHPSPLAPVAPPPPPPPSQQGQDAAPAPNHYVFAAVTPYPPQYPNPSPPQYYQYGYYPPPPPPPSMTVPMPAPYDHHHRNGGAVPHVEYPGWAGPLPGRYPYGATPSPMPLPMPMPAPAPAPYVEHQKAVTIRNDVNLKKETLRVEADNQNPGQFLVTFTFDATVSGSITIYFFAKEGFECNLISTKENLLKPVTVSFKEGLGQKFKQPSGTGIDFSMFEAAELLMEGEMEVYPLVVKAEASTSGDQHSGTENQKISNSNSQITQAVFGKKDNSDYSVRVVKQILWVNGTRYELQEIYGIGNSVDGEPDGNDPGKECVICLSEPRDTTVLPCRHMCMCTECAKVLRFQTNRCPICRQPVERLLEIKVNNKAEEARPT